MNRHSACPVCGSSALAPFLRRTQVPVHQNLVVKDRHSARTIARGDLVLAVCEECSFVFNQAFEQSKMQYGEHYDSTQTCSASFRHYVDNLVRYLIFSRGVQNCRVVEVGCGQGSLLRQLIQHGDAGNYGYGFDPSYRGPGRESNGRLCFQRRYYGPECARIPGDVVICRYVIEHVPDPVALLSTVRQALQCSPHAQVFFETTCLEWILRNQIIWDVYYEHCSYFTIDSLTTAFEIAGFAVDSQQRVFGGQYLWMEARVSREKSAVHKNPRTTPDLAREFGAAEGKLRKDWEAKIYQLACKGKVALWGAGAKGVTLANLVDPECRWIDCVVDLNPEKQGYYVPGTGHPIVGYLELAARQVTAVVLMNPNYHDEIVALLRQNHLDIDVVE